MNRFIKTIQYVFRILLVLGAVVLGILHAGDLPDFVDRSGWSTAEDGTVRYLDTEGEPLLGWYTIEGETYYLDPEQNGAVYTGWLDTEDGRFFLNESGVRAAGWVEINGATYCFSDSGAMLTGWIETESGRMYLDESGALQTGWLELDGTRYYLRENGVPCVGWQELDGKRYYFGEDGVMQTGWLDQPEGRYYLSESGAITDGWVELDGKRYLLTEDGTAYTGWMEVGEDRYYFRDDGMMAIGRMEIDGTVHYFTSAGKDFVMVNPWNPVPEGYEPDLVEIDGFRVDASCLAPLKEMIADCEAAGYSCKISSAYRSYDRQVFLFERKVTKLMGQGYSRTAAEKETALSIAIPGTSEHQLGLAVDLKNGNGTYKWLEKNSWKYGFIMRYPYGTTELTGIYYEPWHFRYVGDELAKELYDLGICLEEYMNLLTEQANSQIEGR